MCEIDNCMVRCASRRKFGRIAWPAQTPRAMVFGTLDPKENAMKDQSNPRPRETKADRVSRFIVAIVTCLGALGMAALLYFPLQYLQK